VKEALAPLISRDQWQGVGVSKMLKLLGGHKK